MKLEWTDEAEVDRGAIYDWIEADDPRAAMELDQRFSHRATQLLRHPAMGRPGRAAGTRELVIRPNYLLIYRVEADAICILRVLHAARQWPPES